MIMTSVDILKSKLIDKILVTQNLSLLEAIDKLMKSSYTFNDEILQFSSEQIEMLIMSEEDIKYNRLISQDELDKSDKEWLG